MLKSILQPVLRPVLMSVFGGSVYLPPSSLGSKLLLWIDAFDTSRMTILNTNKVSNYLSKGTWNWNFTQATDSQRPVLTNQGLSFTPASLQRLVAPNIGVFNNAGGFRVFAVTKVNGLASGGSGRVLLAENNNASLHPSYQMFTRATSGNSIRDRVQVLYRDSAGTINPLMSSPSICTVPALSDTQFTLFSNQDSGTNYKAYINGNTTPNLDIAYTRTSVGTTTKTVIGCSELNTGIPATGSSWDGFLKHLVVTSNNLTAAEEINLNQWLLEQR